MLVYGCLVQDLLKDLRKYSFSREKRLQVRQEYSLEDRLTIGHVGGFNEQKNHKFLSRIFHEIVILRPDAKLFMIGDGPLKSEIELLCSDICKNVIFTGNTDKVPELLQAMDGMVLPSLFEGLPLVVIEWQINGLPCLLSNTVTKECAFTDNVHFMSLNESPILWAKKIIKFAEMNNRVEAAEDALNKVRENEFDIAEGAKKLKTIYMND